LRRADGSSTGSNDPSRLPPGIDHDSTAPPLLSGDAARRKGRHPWVRSDQPGCVVALLECGSDPLSLNPESFATASRGGRAEAAQRRPNGAQHQLWAAAPPRA
jgi:hypothetical protein